MMQWWEGLSLMQQVFACAAIPATLIMLLQTVLLLFGLGGHGDGDFDHDFDHDIGYDGDHDIAADTDHDFDHDISHDDAGGVHPEHGAGMRLITVRGLVAFFAVGGWFGVAAPSWGASDVFTVVLSLIAGFAALLLVALALRFAYKMQDNGNLDPQNAIGLTGQIYIDVPPALSGRGKINVVVQQQLTELEAMTESENGIKAGVSANVVSVMSDGTLLVEAAVPASETVERPDAAMIR